MNMRSGVNLSLQMTQDWHWYTNMAAGKFHYFGKAI